MGQRNNRTKFLQQALLYLGLCFRVYILEVVYLLSVGKILKSRGKQGVLIGMW